MCVCVCVWDWACLHRDIKERCITPAAAGFCTVWFLHLFVFIFLLILWFKLCFWQWLLWHSWRGRGRRRERSARTNLEKHESFSVMLFQPNLPLRQAHHGSIWLMTSVIVGPCAYDLLIKFVFTPRELVGLAIRQERCCITKSTDSWAETRKTLLNLAGKKP